MKRSYLLVVGILVALFVVSCSKSDTKRMEELVPSIQNCAKLYTTQYKVHKILTYEDMEKLEGSIFSEKFSIPIPGDRKLIVPIDATIKCYIDFTNFSSDKITIKGDKITITLPNPQIVLSSAKIDYKHEKQFLSWNRSKFSEEEKEQFIQQGRASILTSLAQSDIIDRSRMAAFNALQPLLLSAGFKSENIQIEFSEEVESSPHSEKLIQSLTLQEK